MEAHLAAIGLGQCLARDDFEQQHEFESVTEVIVNVVNGCAGLAQMTVAPGCECLQEGTRGKRHLIDLVRNVRCLFFEWFRV